MHKPFVIVSLIFFVNSALLAQEEIELIDDSTFVTEEGRSELFKEISDLDPERAALLSAVLPGLGQVYNRQYWKVPLVVSGLVVFTHFINYNNKIYQSLRNAAIISNETGDNPYSEVVTTTELLVQNRDIYRRNRDFTIILGTGFYLLQIIDAHVSAHLDEFAINKDLALRIEPSIEPTPLFSHAVGISFALSF